MLIHFFRQMDCKCLLGSCRVGQSLANDVCDDTSPGHDQRGHLSRCFLIALERNDQHCGKLSHSSNETIEILLFMFSLLMYVWFLGYFFFFSEAALFFACEYFLMRL